MKEFNNYTECIDYLYSLQRFGIKFGLNNISILLNALDSPHNKFRSIHIAGTNGKGSVATILGSILKSYGHKVGIYTSPHLVDYCERITVNGITISHEKIIELTNEIVNIIQNTPDFKNAHPTYFEVTTAQAFKYFAEEKVDFAIIEVGMGGRLDATNVITPLLSIITSIGLEHTDILGDTIPKIAREKAGIIKQNIPVITGASSEALETINQIAQEKQAPLYVSGKNFHSEIKSIDIKGNCFNYYGINNTWKDLFVSLAGEHQINNACLSLAGIEILNQLKIISIEKENIYNGLKSAYWPGRMEVISSDPIILLDGAHNPDGARTLRYSLEKFFPNKRIYLIIGILKDKDREKILELLCPIAYEVILTTIAYERASDPGELYKIAIKYNKNIKIILNINESINHAKTLASRNDLICIAGSLYVIGEAISILRKNKSAL